MYPNNGFNVLFMYSRLLQAAVFYCLVLKNRRYFYSKYPLEKKFQNWYNNIILKQQGGNVWIRIKFSFT